MQNSRLTFHLNRPKALPQSPKRQDFIPTSFGLIIRPQSLLKELQSSPVWYFWPSPGRWDGGTVLVWSPVLKGFTTSTNQSAGHVNTPVTLHCTPLTRLHNTYIHASWQTLRNAYSKSCLWQLRCLVGISTVSTNTTCVQHKPYCPKLWKWSKILLFKTILVQLWSN